MNRTLFIVVILAIGYILGVKFPQLANTVGL